MAYVAAIHPAFAGAFGAARAAVAVAALAVT
jgi:hypothetical protein